MYSVDVRKSPVIAILFFCAGVAACSPSKKNYAPVVDAVIVKSCAAPRIKKNSPKPAAALPKLNKAAHVPMHVSSPSMWLWPSSGAIIENFSTNNKGINIAGREGDPVFASAAGTVVYCGNGLRDYGNLIIIKHSGNYLSAYAHNKVILVKQGTKVRAGQQIAKMGNTGTRRTMVHFEIRKDGHPMNPLFYLAKKN